MDVFAWEKGTSYHHSAGGCKVYAALAVIVRGGVKAARPYHRSIHHLPSNLSVKIPDDDFHISSWAAVILLLQPRVECFFLFFGSFFVWAVDIDDAVVEETASDPQLAHPVADVLPANHPILHLTHHNKAGPQLLVVGAAALVECGISPTTIPVLVPLPAKLLQCDNVEFAGSQFVRQSDVATLELQRPTIPGTESPIGVLFVRGLAPLVSGRHSPCPSRFLLFSRRPDRGSAA